MNMALSQGFIKIPPIRNKATVVPAGGYRVVAQMKARTEANEMRKAMYIGIR